MLCADLGGWDGGVEVGRRSRKEGMCVCVRDSLCLTAETNATL